MLSTIRTKDWTLGLLLARQLMAVSWKHLPDSGFCHHTGWASLGLLSPPFSLLWLAVSSGQHRMSTATVSLALEVLECSVFPLVPHPRIRYGWIYPGPGYLHRARMRTRETHCVSESCRNILRISSISFLWFEHQNIASLGCLERHSDLRHDLDSMLSVSETYKEISPSLGCLVSSPWISKVTKADKYSYPNPNNIFYTKGSLQKQAPWRMIWGHKAVLKPCCAINIWEKTNECMCGLSTSLESTHSISLCPFPVVSHNSGFC